VALDKVVADDHDMNLRKFELSEEEWIIATNLRDVLLLKVVRVSREPQRSLVSDCISVSETSGWPMSPFNISRAVVMKTSGADLPSMLYLLLTHILPSKHSKRDRRWAVFRSYVYETNSWRPPLERYVSSDDELVYVRLARVYGGPEGIRPLCSR
jgi:hypothetical protein